MLGAVIFDFDGVIADDERLHLEGFRLALDGHGISISEADYFSRYVGLNDRDGFTAILADGGGGSDTRLIDALMEKKARIFRRLVSDRVRIFPGVRELLAELRAPETVPTAIASGALRSEIDLVLGATGLGGCFDDIVAAGDVSAGKPDPESFVLALRRLRRHAPGLEAGDCVVIEDSVGGLEAAAAAGMRTLAVTNTHAAEQLEADLVVDSLEAVSRQRLSELFEG